MKYRVVIKGFGRKDFGWYLQYASSGWGIWTDLKWHDTDVTVCAYAASSDKCIKSAYKHLDLYKIDRDQKEAQKKYIREHTEFIAL